MPRAANRLVALSALISSALLIGCADRSAPMSADTVNSDFGIDGDMPLRDVIVHAPKDNAPPQAGGKPPAGRAELPAPVQDKPIARKIIYTATIDLVVEEFDRSQEQLLQMLKEQGGYVAHSETRGIPGQKRSGSWTVRVPIEHFDAFLAAIDKIGELRRKKLDSQDITDQYYDLKAHVKNDEVREAGLQKLYLEKAATSKLEDLLAVDRELSSVRGRIEQQKGQIERWNKETALATVHINLFDRRDYKPDSQPEFRTTIGRTFQASIDSLVSFGKFLVLTAVAVAPWLPIVALFAGFIWYRRRRHA